MTTTPTPIALGPEPDDLLVDAVVRGGGRVVDLTDAEALVWAGDDTTRFRRSCPTRSAGCSCTRPAWSTGSMPG